MRWCALQYALRTRALQRENHRRQIDNVLMTVGNITIAWAGVERILDELIAYHQWHHTRREKQHPVSLSNKLEYLKTMQRNPRFTREIREYLRTVRIEGKRLGTRRHDIIHGMLHLVNSRAAAWRTQRVTYEGPHARLVETAYTQADLMKLMHDIGEFSHELSPKVWVITGRDPNAISRDSLQKARRELGMTNFTVRIPSANFVFEFVEKMTPVE